MINHLHGELTKLVFLSGQTFGVVTAMKSAKAILYRRSLVFAHRGYPFRCRNVIVSL